MQAKKIRYGSHAVDHYFDGKLAQLHQVVDRRNTVIITDENVFAAHAPAFRSWKYIVLQPGERFKVQDTVDLLIAKLIKLEADRNTVLVGIGGGVITDLTGYVASIYMRGIRFGFVPSSLLAMVDAAIGGKNGIDVGSYKNMVGTIRQPAFILHDMRLLDSLPETEWRNGFAEIIKHAAIRNASLFREIESNDLTYYRKNKRARQQLVEKNALLKIRVVQHDEMEQGERKLLNFGHTLGHALENQYGLMHGEAVALGMCFAARLSARMAGLKQPARIENLVRQYGLPTAIDYYRDRVIEVLKMDKKRAGSAINFILLERIGKAVIRPVPIHELYENLS